MRVGILALQGAFAEHAAMFGRLGCEVFEIRQRRDIEKPFDALVLPGGESTVMNRLLRDTGLFEPLRFLIAAGMPTLGTCAGLLLLAKEVEGGEECFALMDITARRNAYGRQTASFACEEEISGISEKKLPLVFIRAPYISRAGSDVEVLCRHDGKIVAARQENIAAAAFHPELTEDDTLARWFVSLVN